MFDMIVLGGSATGPLTGGEKAPADKASPDGVSAFEGELLINLIGEGGENNSTATDSSEEESIALGAALEESAPAEASDEVSYIRIDEDGNFVFDDSVSQETVAEETEEILSREATKENPLSAPLGSPAGAEGKGSEEGESIPSKASAPGKTNGKANATEVPPRLEPDGESLPDKGNRVLPDERAASDGATRESLSKDLRGEKGVAAVTDAPELIAVEGAPPEARALMAKEDRPAGREAVAARPVHPAPVGSHGAVAEAESQGGGETIPRATRPLGTPLEEALEGFKEGAPRPGEGTVRMISHAMGDESIEAHEVKQPTLVEGAPQAAGASKGASGAPLGTSPQSTILSKGFVGDVSTRISVQFGKNNFGKATIALNPPELGELKVELVLRNNVVKAVIATESLLVRDTLEGSLSSLKSALEAQGLSVDEITVRLDDAPGGSARDDSLRGARRVEGGRSKR